jgi:hypothetical protein
MDSENSYAGKLAKRPPGLNELGNRIFDVLAAYTAFPWPILDAQAKRSDLDPFRLEPAQLRVLIPKLIEAVASFARPEKVEAATAALQRLLSL